jgi:hypothetical protein
VLLGTGVPLFAKEVKKLYGKRDSIKIKLSYQAVEAHTVRSRGSHIF